MGKRLLKYYATIAQLGGVKAKMRLTMKTGIPATKAGTEPDSEENLEKFYQSAKEIIGPNVQKP